MLQGERNGDRSIGCESIKRTVRMSSSDEKFADPAVSVAAYRHREASAGTLER